MTKPKSQQPWALLYNLESHLGESALPALGRVGRPRSPIPRKDTLIQLSSEERKNIDELYGLIKKQFAPAKISRGQIVGFSLRLTSSLIDQKGGIEDTKDWGFLWEKLSGAQNE
jgi:hypothetical protein